MRALKAFVSFSIAFFLVLTLVALALAQNNAVASSSAYSSDVLLLEKKYYADLALKQAFSQTLSLSVGADERQVSENTAKNLEALEAFAEDYFAGQGVLADLWFGSIDFREEQEVLQETVSSKKPVACSHCFDFNAKTLDWNEKIVHKSIELIFERKVSRKGFSHTPSSAEWVGGEIAFGGTFYHPQSGLAWVSVVREGFG